MFRTKYISISLAILPFLERQIFIAVYLLQIYITIRTTLVELTWLDASFVCFGILWKKFLISRSINEFIAIKSRQHD